MVTGDMWFATVCFNGVGRTDTVEVSSWLSDACRATTREDSLDEFLRRLQSADSWLSSASPQNRRHSFIIASFSGRAAIVSMVSNYERFDGPPATVAAARLAIYQFRPTRAQTFVSGQPQEILRPTRRLLAALASETSDTGKVFASLARINREVAAHNEYVSASCFTTFLWRVGEGGGKPHEIDVPARLERIAPMRGLDFLLRSPPKGYDLSGRTLKQFVFSHGWATEEYHAIMLEDKPGSPEAHVNYGVFLQEKKKDDDGAERAYRKALAMDPANADAMGNLANIMAHRGRDAEAKDLYLRALAIKPGQENVTFNCVNLLRRRGGALPQTREILELGIRTTPGSGRLQMLLGDIELSQGNFGPALIAFQHARGLTPDQASVEAGCAVALHLSGAPIEECIGSYRTAIALNPTSGGLHLNLAQLLFAVGLDEQGETLLRKAWQFGLDAPSQLEGYFYALAHTVGDATAIVSSVRRLLEGGARMNWNMAVTLERVRTLDPSRAKWLGELRDVLVGNAPVSKLEALDITNGS